MIGHRDESQGHKHTDSGHEHPFGFSSVGGYLNSGGYWAPFNSGKGYANLGLQTKYDDVYGEPRIGTENTSKYLTIKYWKRIA